MKKMRDAIGLALATLALTSMPVSAYAEGVPSGAAESPIHSYRITVSEHLQGQITKNGKSGLERKSSPAFSHFFSPQSPSYAGDSRYDHFTGQVHYGSSSMTFAWGLRLHPDVSGTATGPMSETATLTADGKATGYKDTHSAVPANYLIHSSFAASTKRYVLTINEQFPIRNGMRQVRTVFDFTVTLI